MASNSNAFLERPPWIEPTTVSVVDGGAFTHRRLRFSTTCWHQGGNNHAVFRPMFSTATNGAGSSTFAAFGAGNNRNRPCESLETTAPGVWGYW